MSSYTLDSRERQKATTMLENTRTGKFRNILGVRFFAGSAKEGLEQVRGGGLVVVPSGPGLKDLPFSRSYREALLGSDLAITDSMCMVLLWNILMADSVPRVSGLAYMKELLRDSEVIEPGNTLWVMPSPSSAKRNLDWLREQGIVVRGEDVYLAPRYSSKVEDPALAERLKSHQYRHIILTVGSGKQEQLGHYLKNNLSRVPAIHCIGAAIAFLSGDQVYIPSLVDTLGLGWLWRCLWKPLVYIPRYWSARKLFWLMIRYRDRMPPLRDSAAS